MKIAKNDIPVALDAPGAVARQASQFGDATGYGTMTAEYITLSAGTDVSPLLEGLARNMCPTPHWGYALQGELTVTYEDGRSEVIRSGDVFYLPPGHTVRVGAHAEIIMFSPQAERNRVITHQKRILGE